MLETKNEYKYKITKTGWIVIITVAIIILSFIFWLAYYNNGGLAKNKSIWQAIFLSNNQTYFGQIVSENSDSLMLHNIYYLQEAMNLHQGADNSQKDFTVIKLGGEIHGPLDEMRINRQHVLFVEDLKEDSKIVKAIDKFEDSKK